MGWKSRKYGKRRGQHFKSERRGHVETVSRGTQRLGIPKRTVKKKRVEGFSRLTRVVSRKQAVYGHSIAHSPRYQKSVMDRMGRQRGKKFLEREHDFLVSHYIDNHDSPFKIVV